MPFLPMLPVLPVLPVQILANNLLYDIGQTTIPTDAVDPERIVAPRRWDLTELTRFVLFIGPCSSVFDYTTFFMMLYMFNCWDISTPQVSSVQRESLSDRLVRREPVDAVTGHSRDPNQQGSTATESVILAGIGDEPRHHGDRNRHPALARGPLPGIL